jgi:hypothetical protein
MKHICVWKRLKESASGQVLEMKHAVLKGSAVHPPACMENNMRTSHTKHIKMLQI